MKLRISTVSILTVSLALVFIGCQGGSVGNPAAMTSGMNYIPAGEYKIFVGFKPAQITQSELFKNLTANVDREKYDEAMMDFEQQMGVKLEEITQVIGVMEIPNFFMMSGMPDMLVYCDGAVDNDHLQGFFKKAFNMGEFEEAGEEGKKYWRTVAEEAEEEPAYGMAAAAPTISFASTGDAFIAGSEDSVKGSLDIFAGGGSKLADDGEFKAAYGLIDPGASVSFMAWGFAEQLKPFVAMAEQTAPTPEDKEAMKAFGNLTAAGMSMSFTADVEFLIKMKFADGGSAEAAEKFVRDSMAKAKEEIASGEQAMMLEMYGFEKDEFLKMYDSMEISRAGDVVQLKQTIPGDSEFFKKFSEQIIKSDDAGVEYEEDYQ